MARGEHDNFKETLYQQMLLLATSTLQGVDFFTLLPEQVCLTEDDSLVDPEDVGGEYSGGSETDSDLDD
jgi:hypothetical protein